MRKGQAGVEGEKGGRGKQEIENPPAAMPELTINQDAPVLSL